MASQVYCHLVGPGGTLKTGLSCTELTVGELVDSVSGLSVGEVWEGQTVVGFMGEYNAGTALIWALDNRTKQRFLLGCVNITTAGNVMEYLDRPFQVTKDMIIQCMTQAVV